jgi:beta-lactamase superfamily II metal-dependent hydrolase
LLILVRFELRRVVSIAVLPSSTRNKTLMRIHLLDVGETKYGDCILIRQGERAILIDGAHPGDTARIRTQLAQLFQHGPPFALDLLVVTHCHNDHIGCLPALVAEGTLTALVALVADEKLGWGHKIGEVGHADTQGLPAAQQQLLGALQEEDYSELPLPQLQAFLQDAATLEQRYGQMLRQLEAQGTALVRYGYATQEEIQALETAFADFGLQILGPTSDQLILCAEAIAQGVDALEQDVMQVAADAWGDQLVAIYRDQVRQAANAAFAADRAGVGAAKNNQSIVLKVEADGWRALLPGDMQFAQPQVPGLAPFISALREQIVAAGPYDFIKLAHHSSYNAVDATVLDEWSTTTLYAHTGGRRDGHHPDEDVLSLLKSRREQLQFARTDRNGLIAIEKADTVLMRVAQGRLNDFSLNSEPDTPAALGFAATTLRNAPAGNPPPANPFPLATGWSAPAPPLPEVSRPAQESVEVYTRVPHQATRVTVTIQVEPGAGAVIADAQPPPSPARLRLGGGRVLPKLLFVTSQARLARNIGQVATGELIQALAEQAAGHWLDLPAEVDTAEQAAAWLRPHLVGRQIAGVVLIGGLDVVPAQRLDVLDAVARRALEQSQLISQDADAFIVWSDDLYGDVDGDTLPELPVSRIPDAHRADVVLAALQAPVFTADTRFGIYNLHRPFAQDVFPLVPGQIRSLEVSERCSPASIPPQTATGAVYYMLHGAEQDGSRFWGETQDGQPHEAVSIDNIPANAAGTVVFTGCCWGALTMVPPAVQAMPGIRLLHRGPKESMALAYLQAGATAFIGCTGSHYSPLSPPYNYFGKPLHDAFWVAIAAGNPPARALFIAKQTFAQQLPHGRTDPFGQAVEVKTMRQYTCLGLGW